MLCTEIASNKLEAFHAFKKHIPESTPEYTTSKEMAQTWLDDNRTVVVRALLSGHSGAGITIASGEDVLPDAPLYVEYIKKQHEYRVHVMCGKVLDVQRKMRNRSVPDEEVNWQVRNHSNGFVFGREGVDLTGYPLDISVAAVKACGLDFGAVDIIFNAKADKYYVLEVNTAPGLTGTTLEKYTEAIEELML